MPLVLGSPSEERKNEDAGAVSAPTMPVSEGTCSVADVGPWCPTELPAIIEAPITTPEGSEPSWDDRAGVVRLNRNGTQTPVVNVIRLP